MAKGVKNKVKIMTRKILITIIVASFIMIGITIILSLFIESDENFINRKQIEPVKEPEITEMLLTPNKYSRPQLELANIKGVVVHYTANPGSTAEGNRNYFENLKNKKTTYASSHFVIGLEGEIIQCVPLTEVAYCSNNRNSDTISIECCHPKKNGKFTKETYNSLIKLVAWLCGEYNIDKGNIIRHYDVTGKLCPKYFVEHEDKWEQFKDDVFVYIEENPLYEKEE